MSIEKLPNSKQNEQIIRKHQSKNTHRNYQKKQKKNKQKTKKKIKNTVVDQQGQKNQIA